MSQPTNDLPIDTTAADAAAVAAKMPAEDVFDVPAAFAEQGFERLPTGLFAIQGGRYIYRPMRAWDTAQKFADDLVQRTGGAIYTLVHACLVDLQEFARMQPEEGQTREQFVTELGELAIGMQVRRWREFVAACPDLRPYELARTIIEACAVRRLPDPNDARPEAERDPGGLIFQIAGAGRVEHYYRGRRQQILRIAAAAAWGSVGDFFGVR